MRRTLLIVFIGVWCSVTVFASSQPSIKEANALREHLQELQAQGLYSDMLGPAARYVEVVREITGESSAEYAQALYVQGVVYGALSDYQNAEGSFRSAIHALQNLHKPLNKEMQALPVDIRLQLATALQAAGKLPAARDELTTLIEHSDAIMATSQRFTARFLLGDIDYLMGQLIDARKWWGEANDICQKKSDDPSLKVGCSLLEQEREIEGGKAPDGSMGNTLDEPTRSPIMKPLWAKARLVKAMEARSRDQLDTARTLLQEALKLTGPDNPDSAPIYNELAAVERESVNLDLAEHYLEEQERVLRKLPDQGGLKLADALIEHANLLYLRGDSTGACRLIEQAYQIRKPVLPMDNVGWAETFHLQSLLAESQGELDDAEQLERQALRLRRAQYPEGHVVVADSLENLYLILLLKGDVAESESMVTESLRIFRERLPAGNQSLIFALIASAKFYQSKGDLNKTQALLQEALHTIPPNLPWSDYVRALVQIEIALNFMNEANPSAAEPYFTSSQGKLDHVLSALKNERNIAELSESNGDLLLLRGECVTAESYLRSALGGYQRLGPFHPEAIRTATNLSVALRCRGDYAGAKALLQPILNELPRTGRHTIFEAWLEIALARVLIDMDDDSAAEPLLRNAIYILTHERGSTYVDLANIYLALGELQSREGHQEEAKEQWSHAEEIAKQGSDAGHPVVAQVLLARAQALLHNPSGQQSSLEAVRLAMAANNLLRARFGTKSAAGADALRVLATARWASGDLDGALSAFEQEDAIEASAFVSWLTVGDESRYANLLGRISLPDPYVSFHMNGLPRSREAAELGLSAVLERKGTIQDLVAEQALVERNAGAAGPLITAWKQKELAVATCAAAAPSLSLIGGAGTQAKDCAGRILGLEADAGAAFQQISERFPTIKEAGGPINLVELSRRLREAGGYALVEIVLYKSFRPHEPQRTSRYAAYVLLPDNQLKWVDLGEQKPVDDTVDALRKAFSNPTSRLEDARHTARELDKLVMEPIRPLLGGINRIFIAPDGDLNLIDFSSLVDETGKYLMDNYSISGLTSGRDLLRLAREQRLLSATRDDHVFANPSFRANVEGPSTTVTGKAVLGTTALTCSQAYQQDWTNVDFPGSLRSKLTAAMPNLKVHDRDNATKFELASLQAPRTIWFLTHGFFCVNQDGFQSGQHTSATWQNPMDRAALVFAGASTGDQNGRRNGYATAREISQFTWDGVQLVVLGACETALGVPQVGDGVYGMRRALVISGTRSQVMTLWKVDGGTTGELLGNYALGLSRREGRLVALREAQRKIRSTHAHPYYWAGFYFMGDPGPIGR